MQLTAPFPYYGTKRRFAESVWSKFGTVDVYSEPFAGSLAVLLHNKKPAAAEYVTDTNAFIANFWRAVQQDPDAVAEASYYPSFHQDLTARHKWLYIWADKFGHLVSEDPDYFDPVAAGRWMWGMCNFPGAGWCAGGTWNNKPYSSGVAGQGVQMRRLARIASTRQARIQYLRDQMQALSDRLETVTVSAVSWEQSVTHKTLGNGKPERIAVFLDPPYLLEGRRDILYEDDYDGSSDDLAIAAYNWAIEHQYDYKIAYCCSVGHFDFPNDWTHDELEYTSIAHKDKKYNRDAVYYSPVCNPPQAVQLF